MNELPPLWLSYDADLERLWAVGYGRSTDGQRPDCWQDVGEDAAFLLDEAGVVIGFGVQDLSSFDVDDPTHACFWTSGRFHVPQLGLHGAVVAEIILAARPFLDGRPTLDRRLFDAACDAQDVDDQEALALWRDCLQAGDTKAHLGIGYTAYSLGRFSEAYQHLRYYTEIAPGNPWNWRWYGLAAEAIGGAEEAIAAYDRALQLSEAPDETDAAELRSTLLAARRKES